MIFSQKANKFSLVQTLEGHFQNFLTFSGKNPGNRDFPKTDFQEERD